jgi:hypothetical protein
MTDAKRKPCIWSWPQIAPTEIQSSVVQNLLCDLKFVIMVIEPCV